MRKTLITSTMSFMALMPFLALAQVRDANSLIDFILDIIGAIIPILVAVAVLFFLFGLVKFVLSAGDETKRAEARHTMIWGIIIIFVMVSVWGLVNILVNTFGLDTTPVSLPVIPK